MLRMIRFGYRSLVLGDVKDEYEDISRALGVEPVPDRPRPRRAGSTRSTSGRSALDWEKQTAPRSSTAAPP